MKLKRYSEAMCNKHVHSTMTGSSRFRFLGLAMVSQCTKFEVSRFTRCEAMNGGAKYRKWGGWEWLGGTQGHGQCHHSIERIRHPLRL